MIIGGNDCVLFKVFSQILHHFTLICVKLKISVYTVLEDLFT